MRKLDESATSTQALSSTITLPRRGLLELEARPDPPDDELEATPIADRSAIRDLRDSDQPDHVHRLADLRGARR